MTLPPFVVFMAPPQLCCFSPPFIFVAQTEKASQLTMRNLWEYKLGNPNESSQQLQTQKRYSHHTAIVKLLSKLKSSNAKKKILRFLLLLCPLTWTEQKTSCTRTQPTLILETKHCKIGKHWCVFLGLKHQFRDKSQWVSPQQNNEENASRLSQEDSGRGRGRAKRKGWTFQTKI